MNFMKILDNLLYTENHEWVLVDRDFAIVGVTDYAQSELGDIVYVDIDTLDQQLVVGAIFDPKSDPKMVLFVIYFDPKTDLLQKVPTL